MWEGTRAAAWESSSMDEEKEKKKEIQETDSNKGERGR
jgi:hypothetical protein